jgi:hypothetical protein
VCEQVYLLSVAAVATGERSYAAVMLHGDGHVIGRSELLF